MPACPLCGSATDARLLAKSAELRAPILDQIRRHHPGWRCADGLCPSVVGDYIAHRDRTHISQSYAGYLTDELEAQIHLDPSYVAPTGSPSPSTGTVVSTTSGGS